MSGEVRVNGVLGEAVMPVYDSSVIRGDGCFEVLRSYGGRPFAMEQHLDRLEVSATMMSLDLPARAELQDWILGAAAAGGDCAVRVLVTRGSVIPEVASGPRVVVFWHQWPHLGDSLRLKTVVAPWHSAGQPWELAGAKSLSYAPNMAASRRARASGFDEALLTDMASTILEGPTFCVGWMRDGVFETPTLELGILDSITRRYVLELAPSVGVETAVGRFRRDRLDGASEVMVISTMREVQAVTAVDGISYPKGATTRALADAFAQLVSSETI